MTIPKQGGGSEVVKTCPAAMGFAFAAGTTDGPGAFDFKQGDDHVSRNFNSLWIGYYFYKDYRLHVLCAFLFFVIL